MMCRLRTQSFMTLDQTVRPVCVRTDRQTNLVSNIDLVFKKFLKLFFFIHRYILIKNDIVSKAGEWWSHSFEFFEFYKKHLWGFSFHSMQFCIIFPGFFSTEICDFTVRPHPTNAIPEVAVRRVKITTILVPILFIFEKISFRLMD